MQSKRKNVDKRKIFLWCAAAGIVLCAVLFCLWHNRTALAEQRVERALSVTVSQLCRFRPARVPSISVSMLQPFVPQ